jgi:hypothetical protein
VAGARLRRFLDGGKTKYSGLLLAVSAEVSSSGGQAVAVVKLVFGLLKPANWKRFRAGEPVGVAWAVGPSWNSTTLDPWTLQKVFVGKSRLIRTVFMRLEPGKFRWRDAPIWDIFVDPAWRVDAEVPISEFQGHYTTQIYGAKVAPCHKSRIGEPLVEDRDYRRICNPKKDKEGGIE